MLPKELDVDKPYKGVEVRGEVMVLRVGQAQDKQGKSSGDGCTYH